MQQSDFRLATADGTPIFVRTFLPSGPPRAILQIAHGMAEHSGRYARLAQALTERGYGAYVPDHRGHGQTARSREELGHIADEDGWNKVLSDQLALLREIKSRHPNTPVFLMGHSFGSYVARSAALRWGNELAGVIISATTHGSLARVRLLLALAAAERARLGKRRPSKLLRTLTFDAFNRAIKEPRTPCDWLSRDPDEVDKYIADPYCGFEVSTQMFWDTFQGMLEVFTPAQLKKMPKHLPVYIVAGERDPMNDRLTRIRAFHKELESAGLTQVTERVYQGARHELLNEINRDEITRDLVGWLDERLAQRAELGMSVR